MPSRELQIRLGTLHEFIEIRFAQIAWLARMNNRNLTTLRGLDELPIGSSTRINDRGLFISIIAEHFIIDLNAFVARRTPGGFDIGII